MESVDKGMLEFLTARAQPRRVALRTSGGEELDYGGLVAAVRRGAQQLRDLAGARPGRVVAVGIREPVPALIGMLAVVETGAALVPLDVRSGTGGMAEAEKRSRPVVRVAGANLAGVLDLSEPAAAQPGERARGGEHPATGVRPYGQADSEFGARRNGREDTETGARPNEPADSATGARSTGRADSTQAPFGPREISPDAGLILFTSGSSGCPKGVVLSRQGIMANVDAILTYLPVPAFPTTACVLPLSYSYALVGQAFVTFRAGGTVLALGDVPFPARQIELMAAWGASGLSSVPTSLRLLAEAALEFELHERPDLGYLASAGAALDRTTYDALRAAFPHAEIFAQYGLTEASPRVTAVVASELPFALGSVGKPLPGIRVRAIADGGQELPPGEVGELVVQGPSVMLGYLDDPAGTAEVLGPEGLRTGDFGRVDLQGYVFVEGRRDSIVKCAGERVSLEEVTAVIRKAPGLRDACVLAVPDDRTGVRLVAFVEGDPDVARHVLEAVRTHLPPAKRPHRIWPVARLPRSLNGKLDRSALLLLAEGTPDRPGSKLKDLADAEFEGTGSKPKHLAEAEPERPAPGAC